MAVLTELVADLKTLRKGRGLHANNVGERVGTALRDLCDLTDSDGPVEIRAKVSQRLVRLAGDLPADLGRAVLAAFALLPDAQHSLYQDRVDWLAKKIGRDPRTARRRIDESITELAQLACTPVRVRGTEPAAAGWHTEYSHLVLTLDRVTPEVIEHHRIVAAQDDLTELELAATGGREVSVVYGGTLRAGVLSLPRSLNVGQAHEFALRSRLQLSPRQLLHIPRRRCDYLELRVRFDRNRMPSSVSRVRGRPPRTEGRVPVDRAGEIRLTFGDLTRGDGYGACWD